jgi:hypothetical protein
MVRKSSLLPNCIGHYKPSDLVCNGDPDGQDEFQKRFCLWRDRCSAFKEYLRDHKKPVENYVTFVPVVGQDDFVVIPKGGKSNFISRCDRYIQLYKIVNGIRKKHKKRKKYVKRDRRSAVKKYRENAKLRRSILDALFEHFKTHLIESMENYHFTPPRGVIRPGRFYVIDNRKPSKYLSIYCKTTGMLGVPIALVRYKPRTVSLDIELPFRVEDYDCFGNETMKKIHPIPIKSGKFNSLCAKMDKETSAILAQCIAKMIKKGKIKLPPPS